MFMLMEYANVGNVADYVSNLNNECKLLSEDDIWSLFRGVAQGLRHLHHSGIVHRDVKPEVLSHVNFTYP
jgi:serine/threonine protein kinase